MRKNPGKLSHHATILLDNEGFIHGVYLGQTATMVRNFMVDESVRFSKVDRLEAQNYIDANFTFEEQVPVFFYEPLHRVKKKSLRKPGRPKQKRTAEIVG